MGIKAVVMTKQDDMTTSDIKGSSSNTLGKQNRAGSRPMQSMQMHRSEKNIRCMHRSDF